MCVLTDKTAVTLIQSVVLITTDAWRLESMLNFPQWLLGVSACCTTPDPHVKTKPNYPCLTEADHESALWLLRQ